ncbi:MAG TPA: sugar ABC transporter ATP-binding protein [Hyphomicrobiales bacterium]|nr:sugar ABC transporter ATP-binding protein [Hyphomicrobiales bacterium]
MTVRDSAADAPRRAAGPLGVELRGIAKRYGGAQALDDVSVTVKAGEIHALVGENGAGKSTLGKIVAGAVLPDGGEIVLDGRPVAFRSPRDAIREGIALIHQELALVPALSVLDNVFLGVEPANSGVLDRKRQRAIFAELAARIGFKPAYSVRAETLRVAEQQKIEILRALVRNARLIVMDEPTAALTRIEADRLLDITRDLRKAGVTVIYVSHDLRDVLALADTVTVLKDGRHVKTVPAAGETVDSLVTAMLGRSMDRVFPARVPPPAGAPAVLSVRHLTRPPAIDDVSFDLHAGEIVGLAGLVGSGRTEIARAIFAADPAAGVVELAGHRLARRAPRDGIRRGLAMLPESRKDQGLVMMRTVRENVSMAHLGEVAWHGIVNAARERRRVAEVLESVDARAASHTMPVSALSGGNQQKTAIAKWLLKTPKVLLADEPTRGIDVGAKRGIYELIHRLAGQGLGVLLISSELEEILGLAHRVLVVRNGRIVAEIDGGAATEENVMRAAFGEAGAPAHGGEAA